jgi:hypothetical protein
MWRWKVFIEHNQQLNHLPIVWCEGRPGSTGIVVFIFTSSVISNMITPVTFYSKNQNTLLYYNHMVCIIMCIVWTST